MKIIVKKLSLQLLYVVIYLFVAYVFWQIEKLINGEMATLSYIFTAFGALVGFAVVRAISKTKVEISVKDITIINCLIALLTGVFLNCFIGTLFEVVVFHKDIESNEKAIPTITSMAYTIVIAPFAEEYIFRKCAIDSSKDLARGKILMILFSSVLFCFAHSFSDLSILSIVFLSAIIYSILYIINNKFYQIVLIHSGFNIMSAIDSFLHYKSIYLTSNIYIMSICAVLFFISIAYLINNKSKRSDS